MAADGSSEATAPLATAGELDDRVSVNVYGRDDILKAFLGDKKSGVQESNAIQTSEEMERKFQGVGALEPPYSPATLTALLEHSNSLRPNVDAYAMNIDGFGHRFEPIIDLDAPDADDRIRRVIEQEREVAMADPDQPASTMTTAPVTDEEVAAQKTELTTLMRAEKSRLENFFDFCCEELSFVALRRRVRQDLEVIGNAFVEVLRDGNGEVAEFTYVPSFTVRLLPQSPDRTPLKVRVKATEISYTEQERTRRFRLFVQAFETRTVYFKEFGDPRVISASSGKIFPTVEAMKAANEHDTTATEMIHLKIHSPRSVYGVPRWIGTLLSVLGSRQAEEVNYLYFENKSIPPMAILVSGGKLGPAAVKRLESYLETEVKGKRNFHKVLVIEAESGGGASLTSGGGTVRVEIKPLTDAQNKDGLFQDYDERNMDKVGMSFRLPRLLRGDIRDFNRATADAALEFAEQQVFGPEREDFDFLINRRIFSDLGIRFWKFVSNAPKTNDPVSLATIITQMVNANVITPGEARQFAEKVFGKELKNLKASWTRQPIQLTLAGLSAELEPDDPAASVDGDQAAGGEPGTGLPGASANKSRGGSGGRDLVVTRSALGQVITVNEARVAAGYGVMLTADGTPDPRGHLTIAAAQASDSALVVPKAKRRGLRPLAEDPADALIALRDAIIEAEAREAANALYTSKRRELERGHAVISDEAMARVLSEPGVAELIKGADDVDQG